MTTQKDKPVGAEVHGPVHDHGDSKHSHAGGDQVHAHSSLPYSEEKKAEKPKKK